MTDPIVALERYGPLHNPINQRNTTVHVHADCKAVQGDTREITHAAQLPLSADVCRVCDPEIEVEYNSAPQPEVDV